MHSIFLTCSSQLSSSACRSLGRSPKSEKLDDRDILACAGISAGNQSSLMLCDTDTSSCFPADAMVTTPKGPVPMHKLKLGDQVQAAVHILMPLFASHIACAAQAVCLMQARPAQPSIVGLAQHERHVRCCISFFPFLQQHLRAAAHHHQSYGLSTPCPMIKADMQHCAGAHTRKGWQASL